MSEERVTLRTISEIAGVSRMTVSRALRGDATISKATTQHVRKVAEEVGYQRNPLTSAVFSNLRRGHGSPRISFGFLTGDTEKEGWRRYPYYKDVFEGARDRAIALGVGMDIIWMAEPGLTSKRIEEIVHARGLNGLIFGTFVPQITTPEFVELSVPTVAIGYSVQGPQHRVASNQFSAMERVLKEARARGKERVGAVITDTGDLRRAHRWSGAYYVDSARCPQESRIPPLSLPKVARAIWIDLIEAWLKRWRPEAIAIEGGLASRVRSATNKTGQKPWLISLDLHTDRWVGAGIERDFREMGVATSDVLMSLIMGGENGRSSCQRTLLLEGRWAECNTSAQPTF